MKWVKVELLVGFADDIVWDASCDLTHDVLGLHDSDLGHPDYMHAYVIDHGFNILTDEEAKLYRHKWDNGI